MKNLFRGRKQWRCFHCDEVFYSPKLAREHFGSDCSQTPACKLASHEGLPLDLHPKSDALMPCPFCGGEAEMDTQRSYAHLASPHRLGTQVAIYCLACSADIAEDPREIGVSIEDSIYAVRERWNARTSSCDPSTIMAQFDRAIAAIKAA